MKTTAISSILIGLSFLLLCSCRQTDGPSPFPLQGGKNLGAAQLVPFDTLTLSTENISMSGTWITNGAKLLFADMLVVPTSIYSSEGVFERKIFVKGNGPNEIVSQAFAVLPLRDGGYAYLNQLSQLLYFDASINLLSSYDLLREPMRGVDIDDLLRNPNPELPSMYEHEAYNNKIVEFGRFIVFPITTEHMHYNGFMKNSRAKEYYRDSYTLMATDRNMVDKPRLFGNFPPVYNTRMLPNFMTHYVCANESHLFVSYEADSLIYAYDTRLQPAFAFGANGVGVKDNYPQVTSLEQHEETNKKHHAQYGHFLKMVYGNGYLLRQYQRPGAVNALQVYKDYKLVCDEEMPYKRFELVGYIAPYFYAVVDIDFEYETYTMLRFQLR